NDHSTGGGKLSQITVRPDFRTLGEIGIEVTLPTVVAPERDGHGRERFGTDQISLAAYHRCATVIQNIDRHAKRRALNLAGVDRQGRVAHHEATEDFRAPRDRSQ